MSSRPGIERGYGAAVLLRGFSGGWVALQSRLNGELGVALGDGFVAALFSFTSGLVVVGLAITLNPKARQGLKTVREDIRSGRLPWWAAVGGAGGAFLVLTQGLSAGILGVALFTIAVVTGQAFGSLAIDTKGWFGAPQVRLTALRIVGALLAILGAVIALDVLWFLGRQNTGLLSAPDCGLWNGIPASSQRSGKGGSRLRSRGDLCELLCGCGHSRGRDGDIPPVHWGTECPA